MPSPDYYNLMIENDPGTPLEEAVVALKAMTREEPRMPDGNEMKIWSAVNTTDYQKLLGDSKDADPAVSVPAIQVLDLIEHPESLLNINNPFVKDLLTKVGISPFGMTMLESMSKLDVPLFVPEPTETFLQNARDIKEKRENGDLDGGNG